MIKSLIYNSNSRSFFNLTRPISGNTDTSSAYKAAKVKQPPDFLRNPVAVIVRWEIIGKKVVATKSVMITRDGVREDNGLKWIFANYSSKEHLGMGL